MAPRRPRVQWRPQVHSLLSATMQTGRSLESSQIQNCSSGKLSKAFHTSTATVTAVRRELCFRKAKKKHNHNNYYYYECEQTGFGRSTTLFSSARSRLTSWISPWCATLVWSTHGLVSAFFHVGRQFGTSRPNTLACRLRKRPWSFLMGVTIVTPNRNDLGHFGSPHAIVLGWLVPNGLREERRPK